MLVIPKATAPQHDNVAPRQPGQPATATTAAAQTPPNTAEPVLISEGQVLLATAIARRTSSASTGRPPRLAELWHRLVLAATIDHQPPHRYPPRRLPYFERAAMAREMDRL